jgi:hypothetical protein
MPEQQRKKGIADLYAIEDQRRAEKIVPPQTIPEETTASQTLAEQTIPQLTIVPESTEITALPETSIPEQTITSQTIVKRTVPRQTPAKPTVVQQNRLDKAKGYYQVYNDMSDRLVPELKLTPYEQAVLHRLYRLSWGWKKEECEVGMGGLAKHCVMSKSQVKRSLLSLQEKGLIENLGTFKHGAREGNRYKVLPGLGPVTGKTIVKETIVSEEQSVVSETTEARQSIVSENNIKNSNKDFKTHTQAGVRVGSKFTIEECRKYAQHLQATGQGINNPGGYATTIHRTGEADMLIENFLHPEATNPSSNLDTSQCPDCQGTGFYYPKGIEGGVARCKHEQLKEGK